MTGFDELVRAYARAVDDRDRAGLTALFAPGAVVVLPSTLLPEGMAAEVDDPGTLVELVTRFAATHHDVQEATVEVSGDTAHGHSRTIAHHYYERDGERRDYVLEVSYEDTYVRTSGRWLFQRRELTAAPIAAR